MLRSTKRIVVSIGNWSRWELLWKQLWDWKWKCCFHIIFHR